MTVFSALPVSVAARPSGATWSTDVVGASVRVALTNLQGLHISPSVADAAHELEIRSMPVVTYDSPELTLTKLDGGGMDIRHYVALAASATTMLWDYRVPTDEVLEQHGWKRSLSDGRVHREITRVWEIPDPLLLAAVRAHRNYFHFWMDVVSRILIHDRAVGSRPPVLLPPLARWQRTILELSGISSGRVFEAQGDVFVTSPEAVLPSSAARGSIFSPVALETMRAAVTRPAGSGTRLFISREGARRRRISNEATLDPVLNKFGLAKVRLEHHSPEAQIALFASAEVIVAPHGAGLVNAAFAAPDAVVIELAPERQDSMRNRLYWSLAASLGQPYAQIVCPRSGTHDMLVDAAVLEDTLKDLV